MSSSDATPPDRSRVLTETRNPATQDLHRSSVMECLRAMQREDLRAALEAGDSAL